MSEKYSTDDLVRWVEGIAPGFHECCPPFAIIARLRAADKLCEAAREYLAGGEEFQGNDLDKAIAGYEGKEKR